ncbi:kinase-like domain-containing protein [Ochromonadaceae sp. CCMP2298]|nr:kinase-like domain-containing protein [Ochromonadaceae sp. CCMP2298]
MTHEFVDTYKRCNPAFRVIEALPQRILTNPGEGVLNNGLDNEESNLICRVHDTLQSRKHTFTVLDLLGTGTFGQVFRCQTETKEIVAVKVIKNKPAYHSQGLLEIKIARLLNNTHDPHNERHIVRLLESFEHAGHICLVFELLSMSLLDVLTQNQYRGLPLAVVQRFTKQIVAALVTLEEADVIHCDLKPENILLMPSPAPSKAPSVASVSSVSVASVSVASVSVASVATVSVASVASVDAASVDTVGVSPSGATMATVEGTAVAGTATTAAEGATATGAASGAGSPEEKKLPSRGGLSDIKVIDFGSACFEGRTMYSYIQSRFYRSPEVLLGIPYNGAIDMWSLACVCAEMYLGLPLFPGVSQHNQIMRIVEMLDMPPDFMIEGKNGKKYFAVLGGTVGSSSSAGGPG